MNIEILQIIFYQLLQSILILLSFKLYFNENIIYNKIKKNWIIIIENKLIWNHKYAELKHVLNNIILNKDHISKAPNVYKHSKSLSKLNKLNHTKYEVFTSNIINKFLNKKSTTKPIRIIHLKNVRYNSIIDIPYIKILYMDIHINDRNLQKIYNIKNFSELGFYNLYYFIININNLSKIICFTDWRDLYRNNYSLSHACLINNSIKKIMKLFHYYCYPIIITHNKMYAINLVSNN